MDVAPGERVAISLTVNGAHHELEVETRRLLSDALRADLGLTGTHVGCEHGVCGCCTVLLDGRPVRSCLVLAVQAAGCEVRTVEGLAEPDGTLSPLQRAFKSEHALQCGFCTPGFLMTASSFYRDAADMSDEEIREALGGQLCRCTGYVGIVARGPSRGGDGRGRVTTRLFGERVERREDDRLLVGRGRYTDDFEPHAAHAAFVRSDYAHARVRDVDVSGALDVDGVYAVYTYEDLDGRFADPLPLIIPHEAIADGRTQYALARDEVRYVGETIAMVVARDRYVAEDAAGAIVVDYEPLPVVVRHRGVGAGRRRSCTATAPTTSWRASPRSTATSTPRWPRPTRCSSGASTSSAAPPRRWRARAVVARFDEEGGLLVHDATQAPTGIRNGLSRLFDLPLEQVHVVAPDVGGGFGVKVIQFYPEEVLVPLAARLLGMPVKWTEDRREHFIGSTHERRQVHHVRVGASAEGRILALETSFLHDSGAYCPYGLIIPVITAAQLPGPYRLDNYRYDFTAVFTNMVPTSPYRGAGRPHAAYVMERVMDRLADELGLDPAEIRRRNFIGPDEFPYDVGVTFQDGGPTVYDSGDYPRGLDLLLREVDYAGLRGAPRGRPRRGPADRHRARVLRRGHRHRPVRGRGDRRPRRRHRDGGDRPGQPGPGPPDDARPDRRRRARRADRAHPRHDRRHAADRLRRRHVREPHRGRVRQRRAQGGRRGAPPGRRARRPAARGRPRGHRVRRRARRRRRLPGTRPGARPARHAGQPAALRVRRGVRPGRAADAAPLRVPGRAAARRHARRA